MLPYAIACLVSLIFGQLAGRIQQGRYRVPLLLIAILPFCVLAGFRDVTVGNDTRAYPLEVYKVAVQNPLPKTMSLQSMFVLPDLLGGKEPLFVLLGWLVSAFTGNFNALLFSIQLITCVPLLMAFDLISPKDKGLGLLSYGILFFPYGLTASRQTIALAFVVLALALTFRRRTKMGYITVVVATLFHLTAVLGFAVVLLGDLYIGTAVGGHSQLRKRRILSVVSVISAAVLLVATLCFLPMLTHLKDSYSLQLEQLGKGDLNETMMVLTMATAIYTAVVTRMTRIREPRCTALCYLALAAKIAFVLSLFSIANPELARLSLYFIYPVVLYLPIAFDAIIDKRWSVATLIYFVVLGVAYGWVCYVPTNLVPYTSRLLGIR